MGEPGTGWGTFAVSGQLHPELLRRWSPEPSPRQLHALVGDMVNASRLYGRGIKRRLNQRGQETISLVPDSYLALETDDDGILAYEVHESISARLGKESLRSWSLVFSETSVCRDIRAAPVPVDVFEVQNVTTGHRSGVFESSPDIREFGVRTNYFFRWDGSDVARAQRQVRAVPDAADHQPTLDGVARGSSGSFDNAIDSFWEQHDLVQVSAADVAYLRERIGAHCRRLISAWDGVLND